LAADKVDALRKELGLEDGAPSALTLQPVIGQRKAAKSTVHVGGQHRSQGYVGGHNTADEGRELRRFDNVREDRGRGRGGPRKQGLTVSGEAAAKQVNKAFKPKGPRQPGQRAPRGDHQPGAGHDAGNPAAFRTWYVPEGVETGPAGHRNPDGARGPRKPYGNKPGGAPRPGGPRGGAPGGYQGRSERGPGGPAGERGPRREGGFGAPRGPGAGQGPRAPRPYGHPGNAPSFPSDHANPGSSPNPWDKPRGPRPGGPNAGPRPGGAPRPGRPRGGGRPGGGRGPQSGNR
jgi:23S rRNA pseudouridine2605 synthase